MVACHCVSHGSSTIVLLCLHGCFLGLNFFWEEGGGGYFVGLNFFLVVISWVQKFFSSVIRGSKTFCRRYFVDPKFFLVRWKFYLLVNFVIFSCWLHEKKWHRNISEIAYSIPSRFQQSWILFLFYNSVLYSFIYCITYVITQL